MRKIEKLLREHWLNGRPIKISNSKITVCGRMSDAGGSHLKISLILFGHEIATRIWGDDTFIFTLAGHNTLTTRSRLRNVCGINIANSKSVPILRIASPNGDYSAEALENDKWYKHDLVIAVKTIETEPSIEDHESDDCDSE